MARRQTITAFGWLASHILKPPHHSGFAFPSCSSQTTRAPRQPELRLPAVARSMRSPPGRHIELQVARTPDAFPSVHLNQAPAFQSFLRQKEIDIRQNLTQPSSKPQYPRVNERSEMRAFTTATFAPLALDIRRKFRQNSVSAITTSADAETASTGGQKIPSRAGSKIRSDL